MSIVVIVSEYTKIVHNEEYNYIQWQVLYTNLQSPEFAHVTVCHYNTTSIILYDEMNSIVNNNNYCPAVR